MAQTYDLTVERRTVVGKAVKKLRREGLLPGILYGYNMGEPTPVQMASRPFERVYHQAGNVHLVDIHVGETAAAARAFIHSVTRDPISHHLAHVDFLVVNLLEEVTTHVPILLTGEAAAVRDETGLIQQTLDALEVKVLPTEVPESISADVSALAEVGASIRVRDLVVPAGVTVLTDPDEEVARITAPTLQVEEEVAEPAAEGEAAAATT